MFRLTEQEISKLQNAINSGDSPVVVACLMLLFPTKRAGEFVECLAALAEQDSEHAEVLYKAAIVLYDRYFPEEHSGALAALCGLTQLLDVANRESDIEKMIEETYPLVLRAAQAIGKISSHEHEGNGKKIALRVLNNRGSNK